MKAMVLKSGKLTYQEDCPMPVPGKGEVLVRVAAVGLNPVDYKLMDGWGDLEDKEDYIPGLDVAGTVAGMGPDVEGFRMGDRVYYHGDFSKPNGGYAQYACGPSYALAKIPESIRFSEAAALPCAGFTAFQAVNEKLRAQEGRTILIHAGAGGVGGYGIQLAKARGLTVISTCSMANSEYVKSLGADLTLDYHNVDVYGEIKKITGGRGVDYIINTVDGESATKDLGVLAFSGELVAVVENPDFSKLAFYENPISIHQVALGGAHGSGDDRAKNRLGEIAGEFMELLRLGTLKPLPIQEIPLEEIPIWLEKLKKRHVSGKVVAVLD